MKANNNSSIDGVVSDETIRQTAIELARPVTMNGWNSSNTIKAAEVLEKFLSECDGDRKDFDQRVAAVRQQLNTTPRDRHYSDFSYQVTQARELYQYIRGNRGGR